MDNIFEATKGVKVVEHADAYAEKGAGFATILICVSLALIGIGVVASFVGAVVSWTVNALGLVILALGAFLFLAGFCLSIFGPTQHPERYTLQFTDELSAFDLLQIEALYSLERGDKPDVWIATLKSEG